MAVTDGGMSPGDASPPQPSKTYFLVQTRNIASPLPDPKGVTSDGSGGLWIFDGTKLVHFDPTTGNTDQTFTFANLSETLGSGAYGITWDGSAIWISVSGNTNKLVRVDPTTGQITHTMSSPTDLGPSDLEFDGTNLWLSSGTGTAFVIDPPSGGIERHFAVGGFSGGRDDGIALRLGEVWVGGFLGGMEVYDPATGQPIAVATHGDGSAFQQGETGASCFAGDQLVIANRYGITYFRPQLVPGGARDAGVDGATAADGGGVCPAGDIACPAFDTQCRATWADVLAHPICLPQTIDKADEARFDCDGYHVSLIVRDDTSSTYEYDGTTGQLVAVYRQSFAGTSCVVGPPSGVNADCPNVTPVPVCLHDGGGQ